MSPRLRPAILRELARAPATVGELMQRAHGANGAVHRVIRALLADELIRPTGETRRTGARGRESVIYGLAA